MPVAFILDFPGGTLEDYDTVLGEMELGGVAPPGGIYHGSGLGPQGLRVIDVWESDQIFQEFAESKIVPITQRHGLAQPQIERVEVDEVRVGPDVDGRATFAQVVRLDGMDGARFHELDGQIVGDGLPAGLTYHVNGPTDSGWIVVDYWTSKDLRDTFMASKVAPAMQSAGAPMPAIEELALHNTLTAATVTA